MQQRQPHTHMTCGFCLQPKIIRSKPHETKSGQPICPECGRNEIVGRAPIDPV